MPMRNWPSIALLVVLASALPGIAQAVEFGSQGGAAPTGTSPSGFVGVPGPSSYAPERYQAFPPSAAVQNPSCSACSSSAQPRGQQPAQTGPH